MNWSGNYKNNVHILQMENDHFLEIVFGVDVAVSDFFGNQMKTREFFESVDGQIHETKEKCLKRDAELASLQEEAENHIRLIMNAVGPISSHQFSSVFLSSSFSLNSVSLIFNSFSYSIAIIWAISSVAMRLN